MEREKIAFLGAGNMARAIMNGICASPLNKDFKISVYDINPDAVKFAVKKFRAAALASCAEAAEKCLATRGPSIHDGRARFNLKTTFSTAALLTTGDRNDLQVNGTGSLRRGLSGRSTAPL